MTMEKEPKHRTELNLGLQDFQNRRWKQPQNHLQDASGTADCLNGPANGLGLPIKKEPCGKWLQDLQKVRHEQPQNRQKNAHGTADGLNGHTNGLRQDLQNVRHKQPQNPQHNALGTADGLNGHTNGLVADRSNHRITCRTPMEHLTGLLEPGMEFVQTEATTESPAGRQWSTTRAYWNPELSSAYNKEGTERPTTPEFSGREKFLCRTADRSNHRLTYRTPMEHLMEPLGPGMESGKILAKSCAA
ncbi:unnamed protein product [Heligmosomoides polygyrus]|uniref:Testis expressed 36 n=1 Tax=Heligmosomoides polygyrus TaxID=6339 RepID=A0A183G9D8_HELPZ|nr:unnamed protein product [Heligmosomoides polygyrus]